MTQADEHKAKVEALKRAEKQFGPGWLKPIAPALLGIAQPHGETVEEHSLDRWVIARSEPNQEAAATTSLERVGFECFWPKARHIRTVPLRKLPSKTRHRRGQQDVVVSERNAYPGYLFIRQVLGDYDPARICELTGVAGVCCFGDKIATIADFEIEIMRVLVARGRFDKFTGGGAERIFFNKLSKDSVDKTFEGQSKTIGSYCDSSGVVLVRRTLGRVTRVLTAAPISDGPGDGYHAELKTRGVA